MARTISVDEASAAMRAAVRDTVRRHSFLFLIQAALMMLAGLVALIYPLLSSVALVVFLGWLLILTGAFQVISLIGSSQVPHFWLQLVSAALAVIVGLLFVRNPGAGAGTLALLMVVYFMVEGIAKIVFALTIRPLDHWGWVLLSGLCGVVIAAFLLANPVLSVFLFGILIGVQLIAEGAALGWMAWQARQDSDTTAAAA